MKNIFILAGALSFFAAKSVSAQELETKNRVSPISKGHITIGTNLGVTNLSASAGDGLGDIQYGFALNPSAGYFLSNHWLVSAEIRSAGSGTFRDAYSIHRSGGVGLSSRYYFGKPGDSKGNINRLRFYAEAGGSYELHWMRLNTMNGPTTSTTGAGVLKAGFGLNYLLNDNVAFETALGGRRYMFTNTDFTNTRMVLQLELGIRVFLNQR